MHSMSFPSSSMFAPHAAALRRASKKHASATRAAVSKRESVARDASSARDSSIRSAGRADSKRIAKPGVASLPIAHPNAKIHATRKRRSKGLLYRSPDGDVVQVKRGFSWGAFFVGSTTTFLKRLWPLLVAGFVAFFAAAYVDGMPTPSSRGAGLAAVAAVFYFGYMVFCGVNGNAWVAQSLRRRGYIVVGDA